MILKTPRVLSILGVALVTISSAAADSLPLAPVMKPSTTGLSVIYNPDTGNVSATAPAGSSLTALQIESKSASFEGDGSCQGLGGPFDLCEPDKVFKLVTDGFESVNFGQILPAGLDWKILQQDLKVDGASLGGGFEVGDGPWFVHSAVPEPTGVFTLVCGFGLLFASLRRRMRA